MIDTTGTNGSDQMSGGNGADSIGSLAGDDFVSSGNGSDTVSGGSGNDTVLAGNGADTAYGDEGNDTLYGQNGDDTLYGGVDQDLLLGDNGNDWIFGDSGDDTAVGDNGDDRLRGGAGNDSLAGGNGADSLDGGSGNDRLQGGAGDDSLDGGEGIDAAVFSGLRAEYVVVFGPAGSVTVSGPDGTDRLNGVETLHFQDQDVIVPGLNNAPVASDDDGGSIGEDGTSLTGNLLDNDSDSDAGDALSVANAGTLPGSHGSLIVGGDGAWTYTPGTAAQSLDTGESALESFAYTVSDGHGGTDTAMLQLTVLGSNDAPIAVGDVGVAGEDAGGSGNVLSNDTDIDGDARLVVDPGVRIGSYGTLSLGSDGDWLYTPNAAMQTLDTSGTVVDSFAYTVGDGDTAGNSAILDVTLQGSNDAPTASASNAATNEDTTVTGTILAADVDDAATIVVDTGPSHGSVSIDGATGVWTYTPAANFSGTDSFTAHATDGEASSALVTVEIAVAADADTPSLVVQDTSVTVGQSIGLDIVAQLLDTDGSEAVKIEIEGVPVGWSLSAGTLVDEEAGRWLVDGVDIAGLLLTPSSNAVLGTYPLGIRAIATETSNVDTAVSTTATLNVDVLPPENVVLEVGQAIEGYISGATVFTDDGDGIFEPGAGEVSALTNANGNFTLVGVTLSDYTLVMTGGIDVSTNLPFEGVLRAPEGSSVVTPLTNLIVELVDSNVAADVTAAQSLLTSAFGLPAGVDLTDFDPVAEALAGNPDGTEIYAAGVQVTNALALAAGAVDGANSSIGASAAFDAAVASLAAIVGAAGNDTVDLTSSSQLASIVENAASDTGTSLAPGVADAAAQVAAESNVIIAQAVTSGGSVSEILTEVAQVAVVAQGEAQEAVTEAAMPGGDPAAVTAAYTGTALDTVVDAAEVGDVDGGLIGTSGNDSLPGGTGQDAIDGLEGNDRLYGGAGNDNLFGRDGNDTLFGGAGNDRIDGGRLVTFIDPADSNDQDTVDYSEATAGVLVDLIAGTATGDASVGLDSLIGIENVVGSAFADTLQGSALFSEFFVPGAGNDTVLGGGGFDRVSYSSATGGISVGLAAGVVSGDGSVGIDHLEGIEQIRGTGFVDVFVATGFGTASPNSSDAFGVFTFNEFEGMAGNDTVVGNNDTRINFISATGGVTVNLSAGTATGDASVGFDTFSGVDQARGGAFADTLIGGNAATNDFEAFMGRGGNDTMIGGAGFDRADYATGGTQTIGITVNLAAGTITGDATQVGLDVLSGIEAVRGTELGDTFVATGFSTASPNAGFNSPFNEFEGLTGSDTITGNGSTRISHGSAREGVVVDLAAGTVSGGSSVGFDTILGSGLVNAVNGSNFNDVIYGSTISTTVVGGNTVSYNEVFTGLFGDDTIYGGNGQDSFSGNSGRGNDVYFGGNGDTFVDRVDYSGVTVGGVTVDLETGIVIGDPVHVGIDTLRGMEGAVGTNQDDILDASGFTILSPNANGRLDNYNFLAPRAGNDTVTGNGNTEVTYNFGSSGIVATMTALGTGTIAGDATTGTDILLGGVSRITGSPSSDTVYGSAGNESFSGDAGSDTVYGAAGNDSIDGGTGDDTVYGGADNDVTVRGSDGNDLLYGDAGLDTLEGGNGNDTIYGGTENDRVFGGAGNDIVAGDDGNDTVSGGNGLDTMDGGNGNDTLNGDLDDDLIYGGAGNDTVNGWLHVDTLFGGDGDDFVSGDDLGNTVYGDAGNDTLFGGSASSVLYGGLDNDALNSMAGNDTHFGGAGNDGVFAGDGNDTLYGEDGTDNLNGGNGNDLAFGGIGNDTVNSGVGSATMHGDEGDDTLFGGSVGDDTTYGGDGNDQLHHGSANDLAYGGNGNDLFFGGDGDDGLYGGADADSMHGGNGNDTVYGDAGADSINGDGGNNTVYGGDEDDSVFAGTGNDLAFGDTGNDTISGGFGNDTLYGGADLDNLNGDDGNDLIYGGTGSNSLTGGTGADTFAIGGSVTTITDFSTVDGDRVELGEDVLVVSGFSTPTVVLTDGSTLISGGHTWTAANFQYADGSPIGTLASGGAGADTLYGGTFNDLVVGNDANDTLYGDSGDDTVLGGNDDDTLYGGNGNDRLDGSLGQDTVNGGAGADTFVVLATTETIADFNPGEGDRVEIGAGVRLVGLPSSSTISLTDGSVVVAGNGHIWSGANFQYATGAQAGSSLAGTAGNDTLSGGAGSDLVYGAIGNDSLFGADGNDTMYGDANDDAVFGGNHNDTLYGGGDFNRLFGDAGDDRLYGGFGNDWLTGNAGIDYLDGGAGSSDVAFFEQAIQGIVVDLSNSTVANDGWGNGETILGIDNVHASQFADTVTLGSGSNYVFARAGDDTIFGLAGSDRLMGGSGNDRLDGGSDTDRVVYSDTVDAGGTALGGVTVDLANGTAIDNWGHLDTLISVEQVEGSAAADTLYGDGAANFLDGLGGNDILYGGTGNNNYVGGAGNDVGYGGAFDPDNFTGNAGDDVFYGGIAFDADLAANFNDFDSASFGDAAGPIVVDLAAGTVSGSGIGTDRLFGVEVVNGGSGNDTFYRSTNSDFDIFRGSGGNDTIFGAATLSTRADFNDSGNTSVTITLGAAGAATAVGFNSGTDLLFNIDSFRGTAFADIYNASAWTTGPSGTLNVFRTQGGSDTITGNGNTRIEFVHLTSVQPLAIGMAAGTYADPSGGSVVITGGVNRIRGGAGNDTITGDAASTSTFEVFEGMAGNDTFFGGSGLDIASHTSDGAITSGLTIDMAAGTITGDSSLTGTDSLNSIEQVIGSLLADSYNAAGFAGGNAVGFSGAIEATYNVFSGATGNDVITGNGNTRLIHNTADTGIVAVFTGEGAGTVSGDISIGLDSFTGVKGITGTVFADTLSGSSAVTAGYFEVLEGGAGNDTIYGGGGVDTLQGGADNDLLYGGAGADIFVVAGTAASDGIDHIGDFSAVEGDQVDLRDGILLSSTAGTTAILSDGTQLIADNGYTWTGLEFI